MLNYILILTIYISFVVLVYVLKLNAKKGKKPLVLSVLIPVLSVIIQFVFEWFLYAVVYIFSDSKGFYFSTGIIITLFDMIIPFVTVLVCAKVNGIKEKTGIILAISSVIVIISLCVRIVILDSNWKMYIDDTLLYTIENQTQLDLLQMQKEISVFQNIQMVINAVPALILEIYILVKGTEKRKRGNK